MQSGTQQVTDDQKEYDKKLAAISGYTAQHDDKLLDELESKAYPWLASHGFHDLHCFVVLLFRSRGWLLCVVSV